MGSHSGSGGPTYSKHLDKVPSSPVLHHLRHRLWCREGFVRYRGSVRESQSVLGAGHDRCPRLVFLGSTTSASRFVRPSPSVVDLLVTGSSPVYVPVEAPRPRCQVTHFSDYRPRTMASCRVGPTTFV